MPFAMRGAFGMAGGRRPPSKPSSSLPMDEASRMSRAREMGFYTDMPLYHGTNKAFSAFDKARAGAMTRAVSARTGVWTALDPAIAGEFATMAHKRTGGSPQVYPLLHRADKPARIHLTGRERDPQIAATLDDLWSQGFDAVLLRNYTSPAGRVGDILVVKEPAQLRSPYARFDPARRTSAKLLAGGAGAAIVVGAPFDDTVSE